MKIGLENLPENLIIKLEDDFREALFKKIKRRISFQELANRIGISSAHVYHVKNGRHGLRIKTLKQLCELFDKRLDEIESHVSELVSNRGARARISLPIILSEEIARLLGHCFGDGSVSFRKKQFSYSNRDRKLVISVKAGVSKVFGAGPISEVRNKDGTFKVTFSSIVGEVLVAAGAPAGKKVNSQLDVPDWIKNGGHDIKRAFLCALFDDDGSVMISKSYHAKSVNLHFTRKKEHERYFRTFLETLKHMLCEFGIETHGPYTAREYWKPDGHRCVMGVLITDYGSISHFAEEIGFRQVSRGRALDSLLRRGVVYAKTDILNDLEKMKRTLIRTPFSTAELAGKVGLTRKTALKRLKKLEEHGEVIRIGRTAPNRSIIWDLRGGEKTV